MNDFDIKPILECLLFISEGQVRPETFQEVFSDLEKEAILDGIHRIKADCEDPSRGLELVEIAGGHQFRTKPRWAEWVNRLKKAKPVKLSQSALETLAIIAYRQPIIRPAIEEIRGVDSGWIIRTLLEKGLIRILGRKDLPGRPIIYGTTKAFLELFNLNKVSDLPTIKEIQPPSIPEEVQKEEVLKVEAEEEGPDNLLPAENILPVDEVKE